MESKLVYYQKDRPVGGLQKRDIWIQPTKNKRKNVFWLFMYNIKNDGWWYLVDGYTDLSTIINIIKTVNKLSSWYNYSQAFENQIEILNLKENVK